MYYKHQLFLKYLVFIAFVVSLFGASLIAGIFQASLYFDKSYLVAAISCAYLFCEIYVAKLIFRTSKELVVTADIIKTLEGTISPVFSIDSDKLVMVDGPDSVEFKDSILTKHIKNLLQRSRFWADKKTKLDQKVLVSTLGDKIYAVNSFPSIAASLLIYLGILGTVVGIIITFWPFINTEVILDVAKIQQNLGQVFSGIGAALFPSAAAYIFNIFLMWDDRLLMFNTATLVESITNVSETLVVPVLETQITQAKKTRILTENIG